MIKPESRVTSITFDLVLKGKKYKNVTLEYKPEKNWYLAIADCYVEDNSSWCMVELGGVMYDFQVYGNDDEKLKDKYGEYQDKLAFKPRLACQLWQMEYDKENDCYYHVDDVYSSNDGETKFSKVTIHTIDGDKRVRLLKSI